MVEVPGAVEVLQRRHRYAVVWPSIHAVGLYRWWDPDGQEAAPPAPEDITAELPAAWVDFLTVPEDVPADNGPAEAAGLRANDLVTHINGRAAATFDDLMLHVGCALAGSTVGRVSSYLVETFLARGAAGERRARQRRPGL